MYVCICLSRTSFHKSMPPCSNSLDSFDFAMHHQFRNYHHVQIIETASILHLQWVSSTMTSVCMLLITTHDTTQLGHSLLSQPNKATVSVS